MKRKLSDVVKISVGAAEPEIRKQKKFYQNEAYTLLRCLLDGQWKERLHDFEIADDGTVSGRFEYGFYSRFSINQDSLVFYPRHWDQSEACGFGRFLSYGEVEGDPVPEDGKKLYQDILRHMKDRLTRSLEIVDRAVKNEKA